MMRHGGGDKIYIIVNWHQETIEEVMNKFKKETILATMEY